MPGEHEESSKRLAGFIVGELHDAAVVGDRDIPRATTIAAEEIDVNKAMGDYWCSWCILRRGSPFGVQFNDEAISLAADGLEVRLRRLAHVDGDGRIAIEIQSRGGTFSGSYATEMRVGDVLRFASEVRELPETTGGERTATLPSATGDAVVQLTLRAGSTTGRYLCQTKKDSSLAALSGAFAVDATVLARFARELTSLVHDSWGKG